MEKVKVTDAHIQKWFDFVNEQNKILEQILFDEEDKDEMTVSSLMNKFVGQMLDQSPIPTIRTCLKGVEAQITFNALLDHIESYVLDQYEDYPHNLWPRYPVKDIKVSLEKYVNRIGKRRHNKIEAIRDALSIMHYGSHLFAQLIGLTPLLTGQTMCRMLTAAGQKNLVADWKENGFKYETQSAPSFDLDDLEVELNFDLDAPADRPQWI